MKSRPGGQQPEGVVSAYRLDGSITRVNESLKCKSESGQGETIDFQDV